MRVYPVMDLKRGVVVRGVAGERQHYKPVKSRLAPTAEPLDVARAYRERLGLDHLYVADLDALEGGAPDADLYRRLVADGFHLLIDAGVRSPADALALECGGAETVIAALETLESPRPLEPIVARIGPDRVVFSLDLKGGVPLGRGDGWPASPIDIARVARDAGVRRLLVLDLSSVGSGGGPRHLDLCEELLDRFEGLELLTGGGVRDVADLERLAAAGVHGALVASALHDGSIGAAEVRMAAGRGRVERRR